MSAKPLLWPSKMSGVGDYLGNMRSEAKPRGSGPSTGGSGRG